MTTDYKQIRKDRTRDAIKDAALEIAREEGWNGVTIRKIADRIHYTAPIVYEHFRNKDHLYEQLVKDGHQRLFDDTMAADHADLSAEERLLIFAEVRFEFATSNPTLHHMMFDADNPEWQKLELAKSMVVMKQLVDDLMLEIGQDEERVGEYTFNMICLIKGYTYFTNHFLMFKHKVKDNLAIKNKDSKALFLDAVKRFIHSIKQS
jgi:AcrR family transcriptional regulator